MYRFTLVYFTLQGQPIVQIRNASALDTLITLTGGTLAMHDSQSLEPKGNNVTGVSW
jgi:hypothetical protein